MRLGGKLVLSIVATGLVLSGCQSASKSSQSAPEPSADASPRSPGATPEPKEATSRAIALPAPVKTSKGSVAELAPTKTAKFSLLGVTWDRMDNDAAVKAEVRVRKDDGWSSWETLEVDDDGGEAGRGGTEPWWIENADQVSARVTTASGDSPTGVKVVTVDPGEVVTPPAASAAFYSTSTASSVVTAADGHPAYTPRPAIISRASWKAHAPIGCGEDGYKVYGDTTLGVNIHHSAGSNSYSKSQSASIVRGIQKFHQTGRDWCDIAYNFLVDKYGQIFEGRAGGVDRAVRGSHSGNNTVNELTMGVALMGNLDKVQPSTAMKNSTVKLVGYRLGTYYKPAKGVVSIGGKSLNRISGHRNVVSTSCPGKYGYAWIGAKGGLRDRVAAYIVSYRSMIKSAAWRLDRLDNSFTGTVQQGEFGSAVWRRTIFSKMDFWWFQGSADAYYVAGGFRTIHRKLGTNYGVLGFPIANMVVSTGRLNSQRFQGGAIYQVDGTGWHAIWGAIFQKYGSAGGPTGSLGLPTSDIVEVGSTKTATFEHGSITQEGTNPPVIQMGAAGKSAPSEPTEPAEPTTPAEPSQPTPSPSEEGAAPINVKGSEQTFPVLWLRRSGMISA